jgi:endonuclease/exonuclease/phosphatase (EEP) superfamily protein YafD
MHGTAAIRRRSLGAKLGGVLAALTDVIAFALLTGSTFSVLGAVFAEQWHIFDLLAQFTIAAVFGASLAAIIEVARRKWKHALGAGAIAAIGMVTIWQEKPVPECDPGVATRRVVFFNIWVGADSFSDSLAYLQQSKADVIVLTELTKRSVAELAPLNQLYPHASPCAKNATCWTAAFSKTPFTDVTSALDVPGKSPALAAMRISFPDGDMTIAGAHLTRPWPYDDVGAQERQRDALASGLLTLPGPQLVVGDFNGVTWGSIVSGLVDATGLKPIASWGTWRASMPTPLRLPIDHALVGEGITCATKTIGPALGSDHRPIIVDFAL